jgi:hypothetical protein
LIRGNAGSETSSYELFTIYPLNSRLDGGQFDPTTGIQYRSTHIGSLAFGKKGHQDQCAKNRPSFHKKQLTNLAFTKHNI